MPSSFTTSLTPLGGGGVPGTPSDLVSPLPYTLLSLSMFAKILGINPAHFWGTTTNNLSPKVMPIKSSCDSAWYQYSWQDSDKVSRYDIALEIQNVEQEIANFLGYYPAPTWIVDETHQYPRPFAREYFGNGSDVRGLAKGLKTDYGRIIDIGTRKVTLVGTASVASGTLVYSDSDADNLYETATIVLPTTLTNECEIDAYHTGYGGILEWKIREARRKSISGGSVRIVLDSWLLVKPELYEKLPTDLGADATDISTTSNFVTSVDVYREYTDSTTASSTFYWEAVDVGCAVCGGSGCEVCGQVSQDGCARIRDSKLGILSPFPATYDSTNGWVAADLSADREPDRVVFRYYAGERSNEYLTGRSCFPMNNRLAKSIAYMATSRLERPFCECENVRELSDYLRVDLTRNTRESSYFATRDVLSSPFGTRVGEVKAWQYLSKLKERIAHVAVI